MEETVSQPKSIVENSLKARSQNVLRLRSMLKVVFFVSLPCVYIWITVVSPFLTNGIPTGWDTPAYLAWTNTLKTGGVDYVQNPAFIQFNGLNLIPVLLLYTTVSLAPSSLIGYLFFQIIVVALFFGSTLLLSVRLHKSI